LQILEKEKEHPVRKVEFESDIHVNDTNVVSDYEKNLMVHEDIQRVLSMAISDPVEKENLHNKLKNNFMVTVKVIAVVDDHGDNVKNVMTGIKGRGALDSCNWSRFPFMSKEFICANNLERFIVSKPKSNIVLGDGAVAISESIKLEVELFSYVTNEMIKTKFLIQEWKYLSI
jgi:hypothetical protein